MSLRSLHDWLSSVSPWVASGAGRPRGFGRQAGGQALAEARLDFADALIDMRSSPAVQALDRIAVARSLYELWNFREEIFSLVARKHDQGEATRRLAMLDRHFAAPPKRPQRAFSTRC